MFVFSLIFGMQDTLGQQEIRYPKFLEHESKEFAAYVDEITGVPMWIIDTDSLDFTLGTSTYLFSELGVKAAADAFLEAHKGVLGMDLKQLGEPRITSDGEWWYINYPQIYGGFRVMGANVGLTVTHRGKLISVGVTGFPKLDTNTSYSLNWRAAITAARGQTSIPDLECETKEAPVIIAEKSGDRYVFRIAWEVILYNYDHEPPFSKTFVVDANNGKIIFEYSNILEGNGGLRLETEFSKGHRFKESGTSPLLVDHSLVAPIPEDSGSTLWQMNETLSECTYSSSMAHRIYGTITLNYYDSPDQRQTSTGCCFVGSISHSRVHAFVYERAMGILLASAMRMNVESIRFR